MPVRLVSQEELPGPLRATGSIERLGRGGFGEVWKVEAPGGLHKAIKFVFGDLDAAEDDDGRPAEQELKALNRVKAIRHPYILSLERFDIIDGQLIIVMELADRNLWDRFRECRGQGLPGIPRDELLRYMEETAEALDLMNDQYQLQHLDVKPQNLFLVHNHVKVADFGLAKTARGGARRPSPAASPRCTPPRRRSTARSAASPTSTASAIVYQELLTGTRPFNGANTRQLLLQHLNGTAGPGRRCRRPTGAVIGRGAGQEAGRPVAELHRPGPGAAAAGQPGRRRRPSPPAGSTRRRPGRPPRPRPRPGRRPAPTPRPRPAGPAGRLRPDAAARRPPAAPPRHARPAAGHRRGWSPRRRPPGAPVAPAVTLQRPQVFQTGRMSTLGIAPPEKTGDGVLFPALVVGRRADRAGRRSQKLRQLVRDRFGSPDAVPHVRVPVPRHRPGRGRRRHPRARRRCRPARWSSPG